MHCSLLNPTGSLVVDHIDGNGLNNQKSNLRIATRSQNSMNRDKQADNKSGYKGVYWKDSHKKWAAVIKIERKAVHLGLFTDKEEAAKAYNEAVKVYFGEFGRTNVIWADGKPMIKVDNFVYLK